MEKTESFKNQARFTLGCQFGNHGEPFLWRGSGNDEIDLAVMELIRLSELNIDSALEVADEIGSLLSKAKETECTCSCIDCIEGNHCGGLFIVDKEDGEEVVGECKNIDGVLNAMEENGMFGISQGEDEEDDFNDHWDDEHEHPCE